MRRAVVVWGALGGVLGGLGAMGWHWVPAFGDRAFSPIRPRPGQIPLYSGVVTPDQVIHWVPVWWPVVVVLPVLGVFAGAALGHVVARRRARSSPTAGARVTAAAVAEAAAVVVLGLFLGVAGALAWHWDPRGGAWAGLYEEKVDLGYPMAGLALAVVLLCVVWPDGTRRTWRPGPPPPAPNA